MKKEDIIRQGNDISADNGLWLLWRKYIETF